MARVDEVAARFEPLTREELLHELAIRGVKPVMVKNETLLVQEKSVARGVYPETYFSPDITEEDIVGGLFAHWEEILTVLKAIELVYGHGRVTDEQLY